jgi:hypothetical protein
MPQRTQGSVAERARTLANKTGYQATRVIAVVAPQRTGTRAPANGLTRMMAGAKGMATGTRTLRGAPPVVRLAWRSGKATGRAQGMAALAPAAMRGWWASMTRRLPGRRAKPRARAIIWLTPVALGGARLATRAWLRLQRNASLMSQSRQMWTRRSSFLAGRTVGRAQGAKMATRGTARVSTPRPATKARTTMATAKGAGKTLALTARTARATGGMRLRRGWRWMRFFTMGFSTGALWAYLFAPRQGPGYERMQQATQRAQSAQTPA